MPSSVIRTMHYDADRHVLRVVFTSGMVYDYLDVPETVYRDMKSASSKGTFFNRVIKGNYVFKKVE